jgi:hypothetical protein
MAKSDAYSEVDAMRDVDAALSKLDSDAQQRVLNWASSKHRIKVLAGGDGGGISSQIVADAAPNSKDIKSFLAQKRPGSFYERVACLVYYLEKFGGKPEVGTKDITKANSDARLSKLTNPAVFVKHATHTYGYLIPLGKRQFAVSQRGEAVVEALPDRGKVAEANEKYPGKKSKKKTRPKK